MSERVIRNLSLRSAILGKVLEKAGTERYEAYLDDGTTEQNYWHHGYYSALQDVLAFIKEDEKVNEA
jgi:hypothetical protein